MGQPAKPHNALDSRRTFLQQTAVGAFGTAMALGAPMARSLYAGENDKTIKVALIGCGGRGTGAAVQALNTEGPVKLWAMADAFSDRLETSLGGLLGELPSRYDREKSSGLASRVDVPPERRFVGLDAYRKAIDSGVDVVILTGPPGFRPQHFEYAIAAGKHVFMEKPLASDAHGIKRVLAAAEQAKQKNLKVGLGLQRHHQHSYQESLRLIADDKIGRIVTMRCFWNGGPPAKTPFPRENVATELEYQVRNWYFFHWLSGDHICEQHIHNIDVCNWVKGAHPVEAEGMGGRQVRTGKEYGNIFDHHAVIFTYADGTKMHSYCRQISGCKRQIAEEIEGTKGLADLGQSRCKLTSGDKVIWQSAIGRARGRENPYQVEHDVLFDAIRNDKPHNEAEQGALSTMTAILGRLATYSGKAVKWDDAMASKLSITTDAENWEAEAPVQPLAEGGYEIPVPGLTKVI